MQVLPIGKVWYDLVVRRGQEGSTKKDQEWRKNTKKTHPHSESRDEIRKTG